MSSTSIQTNVATAPVSNIDVTGYVLPYGQPLEIWEHILKFVSGDVKTLVQYKVTVLAQPLDGSEDSDRLIVNGVPILFRKHQFKPLVETIFSLALTCKGFYVAIIRERGVLMKAATRAQSDASYFLAPDTHYLTPRIMHKPPTPPLFPPLLPKTPPLKFDFEKLTEGFNYNKKAPSLKLEKLMKECVFEQNLITSSFDTASLVKRLNEQTKTELLSAECEASFAQLAILNTSEDDDNDRTDTPPNDGDDGWGCSIQ